MGFGGPVLAMEGSGAPRPICNFLLCLSIGGCQERATSTSVTTYHRWLALLGDRAYGALVRLNRPVAGLRRALGLAGYWSLAGYAKRQVKTAVAFIADFWAAVVGYAKARGVDAVICGRVHTAAMRDLDGVGYLNCGDWVDSCTGVLEHLDEPHARRRLLAALGLAVEPSPGISVGARA